MTPEEYAVSTLNPIRVDQLLHSQHGHDADDDHDTVICCCVFKKPLAKDDHHHNEESFSKKIIISETNQLYMVYKMCVTILCLVSSYFYGFLSMNDYNKLPDLSYRNTNVVMIIMFETVFLIDLIL